MTCRPKFRFGEVASQSYVRRRLASELNNFAVIGRFVLQLCKPAEHVIAHMREDETLAANDGATRHAGLAEGRDPVRRRVGLQNRLDPTPSSKVGN